MAVIGTGASAIQFVPAIQPQVEKLYVFQRTAPWVVPAYNRPFSEQQLRLFAQYPWLQRLSRLRIYLAREIAGLAFRHPALMGIFERYARHYLRKKIPSAELREKLTPDYRIGCKRILLSHDYYPALTCPNVEVVTTPIETIGARSIATVDGAMREIDAIIFGTGFGFGRIHCAGSIWGREGRTLAEVWGKSPRAYLGTTVAGFPNLFLLFGPNTGLGHSSVVLMAESQMAHIVNAIKFMQQRNVASVEPRPELQTHFNEQLDRRMRRTVWQSGCSSWYLDPTGRNSTLWPMSVGAFRRRVARFRPQDFCLRSHAPTPTNSTGRLVFQEP